MSIEPFTNFTFKHPTSIEFDNQKYNFEGYSIFTHDDELSSIPDCVVVIFNQEYKLNLMKEEMNEKNFTIKELELLRKFIFVEILELYDLKWKGYGITEPTACNRFHIMPRFCRQLPYDGKEILSPCEILKHFLANNVPVVDKETLLKCHLFTNREWLNYVEPLQGSIVTNPGRRPASLRLDQLDRDHILKTHPNQPNSEYPLIIHFSMFRNTWLPMIKNNLKLKKLYHKYFKLRHLLNNKSKLSDEDKTKLRVLGEELQELIGKSSGETHKETMIELSSDNFMRTGIKTDIVQQTLLIPTFVEHLRFHLSLKYLEEKIGYTFKNRLLLQHALTHPSGAFLLHQNLGSNPDHIRNCLFNCKVRNPQYGALTPNKRKSMLRKKGIHMLFQIMSQKGSENGDEESSMANYERLEFLGDKILELLISKHLFFMFQYYDEGKLSEYRNAIVQNQFLAVLARKLDMHFFIIFYHGVDLCSNSALNHALANSFEALLAAIFLDSDLNTVENMLAKTLWQEEPDLYQIWCELKPHPIQAQLSSGDRHLISSIKILQHVSLFEEMIGCEFKHIRLLAQAFCTRSASFNLITLGDNQRLEFLGDTVLNFVVSDYLYRHFPNHHEGHLSLLRSSLVCNSTQALLYDELGMDDFVLTAYINNKKKETSTGNLKRKADVFEAFVGALYIDYGLEAVAVFCNVCMFNKLKVSIQEFIYK
jgi:ribonuclease-3